MRIAHVIDTLAVGGAEVVTSLLCRLQRAAGHEPEVHCLARNGPIGEGLEAEGIPVWLYEGLNRVRLTLRLYSRFRHTLPNAVHCHNALATIVAAPPAWAAGVAAIVSTRHGLVAPPHAWRRELQFAFASRFCSSVVGVCETTRQNLATLPFAQRHKLVTVYNGTPPADISRRGSVPSKVGFTMLWVGRLADPKDLFTLLRALALAESREPGLTLWVVGDGPQRPALERLAVELGLSAVIFLGERRDVGALLELADLFVLCSRAEGMPISVLEAMAAGRPLLITKVGAMEEILDHADVGLGVAAGDVPSLAAAIVQCVRHPELGRWGHAARLYYRERFTVDRMVRQYLNLYNHT